MSARRSGLFLVAVVFLQVIQVIHSTEFVPYFMWSNKRINEKVPALNKISQDVFKEEIQQYLKDNPLIVIFAEQTLSPEDFAQRDQSGVIFSNLAKLAKSTKVSYLPYVQNPIRALKHLDVTVTEVPLDKFGKNFEFPETDILIINLNDAKDSENRIDMLKRHDQAIAEIYDDLAKTNKYVLAIYTSHHTSWVASEEVVKSRQVRSLLENNEVVEKKPEEPSTKTETEKSVQAAEPLVKEGNFYNNSKVYLYVSNTTYTYEKTLKEIQFSYTISNANATTFILNATGTSDAHNVELEIIFTNTKSQGYWTQVDPIIAKVVNASTNKTYEVTPTAQIYAPEKFSFHCGDQAFSSSDIQIELKDFQIQLYFTKPSTTGKFDDAYDCVGFTTVPIWSGLFVTTILLLIMTIGITMMMDIRTMDRFDDAKGKTITINAE